MKEDLRRETHGTAIGGDRGADRRVCSPSGWARTRASRCRSSRSSAPGRSSRRAVEEEFDAWLGRARYERRPDYQRALRNGFRPRRVQTAEGELAVEMPQVREPAE